MYDECRFNLNFLEKSGTVYIYIALSCEPMASYLLLGENFTSLISSLDTLK